MASWLAEVNVTGQFADDQQIQSGNDFRFQRRSACQFRIEDGRTQIGEQFQVFAQAQNSLFRTQGAFQRVIFEIAYSAKQDRIGFLRKFKRAFRQWMTVSGIACATDVSPFHFKFFIKRIQYANGLFQNFRTDTIARQHCNLHVFPLVWGSAFVGKNRFYVFTK